MGQIITLQDGWYNYELPKMPTREEDLLFYDLPKSEQYWRIPPRKDLRNCTQSEKIEYINQERERWLNGVWMFINGEPTYITGMHYDHMVNMKFEFGHALYFDQQRLDFYMRDLVRKDKNCYGVVWYKPRRYGMTAEELTNAIYAAMEDFNINVGLMSNEGTKAVTTLMRPIIDAIIKRPRFMRPLFYKPSGKKPRKSMEFIDGQVDFDEDGMLEEFAVLGGAILPYNTTTAAMDGKKVFYIIMDEVWKWIEASPKETLEINKKCVEQFGIRGKISMLSTMGDSDDYHRAIKEGIQIGDESNPNIRDANGRTTTGMYRYFVSAVHSKGDIPAECTDKFGKVDVGRAEEFIYNNRAKYDPNTKDYTFEVRRMPLNYKEATATADGTAIFPNNRLAKRREELAKLPRDQKPYVRGFFDEDTDGKVSFRPDIKGIWKLALSPYKSIQLGINTENRFRKDASGRIRPPKNQEFCFGYDPVRYADKKAGAKGISNAAILVAKKFDYHGAGDKNLYKYAAILLYRPEDPHEATSECMKAAKFFGMAGMHERQVEHVEEDFAEAKMEDMLMNNEKDNKKGIWTDNNRKVVKNGTDMIQASMKIVKLTDRQGNVYDYDPIDDIPFEEIVYDRMCFDPMHTTENDVTMADIMLQNGMKQMKFTNNVDDNEKKGDVRRTLFPKRA